jgi:hypothetical protein
VGTLYISDRNDIAHRDLVRAFQSLEVIQGDLVIDGSESLVTLRVFPKLTSVRAVVLKNNANLIDAILPSIKTLETVTVVNCPHLCLDRVIDDAHSQSTNTNVTVCNRVSASQMFSTMLSNSSTSLQTVLELIRSEVTMSSSLTSACSARIHAVVVPANTYYAQKEPWLKFICPYVDFAAFNEDQVSSAMLLFLENLKSKDSNSNVFSGVSFFGTMIFDVSTSVVTAGLSVQG